MASATDPPNASSPVSEIEIDDPWIPKGFLQIEGPDNRQYIMPEFMYPALQQQCDAHQKKKDLDAFGASGSVSTRYISCSLFVKCR
jgi:hypothetical protein